MALPNVTKAIKKWASSYTVKNVSRVTVNFVESNVVTGRTIRALIQAAQKEKLNTDQIDWSKEYIQIHSLDQLFNGEYIEYSGADYKVIDCGDWQRYGYTEAVAEETKKTKIVITPTP